MIDVAERYRRAGWTVAVCIFTSSLTPTSGDLPLPCSRLTAILQVAMAADERKLGNYFLNFRRCTLVDEEDIHREHSRGQPLPIAVADPYNGARRASDENNTRRTTLIEASHRLFSPPRPSRGLSKNKASSPRVRVSCRGPSVTVPTATHSHSFVVLTTVHSFTGFGRLLWHLTR